MAFEVQLTLREIIRPCSPSHFKKLELSLIDQLCPPIYTSVVFYYASNDYSLGDVAYKLKSALSRTLSVFYPLAGRIKENLYVECNDEGALYCEARVNSHLVDFLNRPNLKALSEFLPVPIFCPGPVEEAVQVAVQVNQFSCGGIAIGMAFLHKIIDATLIGAFVKSWASICNGFREQDDPDPDPEPRQPHCYTNASFLFPPIPTLPSHASNWLLFASCSKSCTGRYLFSSDSISKLKARASSERVPNPTTIEALTAFIWKNCMRLGKAKKLDGTTKASSLSHAVNLRRRMDPELPEHSIGNILWKAYASVDGEAMDEASEAMLVVQLRKSLSEIDSGYIKRMQGVEGFGMISKWLEEAGRLYADCEPNYYGFSDWCKLRLYGVDLGFGRPAWVCPSYMGIGSVINVAYFVESALPGGVEVWLNLEEEEMRALEHLQEFITFASINPSVSV